MQSSEVVVDVDMCSVGHCGLVAGADLSRHKKHEHRASCAFLRN